MTDFIAIGFLVIMEGLLSFDNALALAAMVAPLPVEQRKKALTYGMIGAFTFRILALCFVTYLMEATWVKYVGGGYLLWLSGSFFFASKAGKPNASSKSVVSGVQFWKIIVAVELMDIAFSIDSILAAVAVSSKLWVVVAGGILGIILMRFAATIFVGLIQRFPRLENSAFILVAIVGVKLLIEALQVSSGRHVYDFESPESVGFWWFWLCMASGLITGFIDRTEVHGNGDKCNHMSPQQVSDDSAACPTAESR